MQTEFHALLTSPVQSMHAPRAINKVDDQSTLAGRRFSKARTISKSLGICPRTLFRWANAGKITRHKINARVVLFDEAEIVAFIESSRTSYPGMVA